MTFRLSDAARSAACNAVADSVDVGGVAGYVEVRTGAQPAHVATAATGTILATIPLNNPAYGNAAAGVAALLTGTPVTATAGNSGTAGWFRLYSAAGVAIADGACAVAGSQLNLSTLTINAGDTVTITSGSLTQPES